jgi:hypothetical protein
MLWNNNIQVNKILSNTIMLNKVMSNNIVFNGMVYNIMISVSNDVGLKDVVEQQQSGERHFVEHHYVE